MMTTDNILHERFCTPRPGETEPRTERYKLDVTGPDGIVVVSRPEVHRCIECGSMTVDGKPR